MNGKILSNGGTNSTSSVDSSQNQCQVSYPKLVLKSNSLIVQIQNFVLFTFYLFFHALFLIYYWVWFWVVCTMLPHPKTVGGPCTKRTKVCCGKSFVGTKRKFVTFQWIFIINTDSFQLVHNFYSTYLELWKWNSR